MSASKRKGTAAETAVVNFLRERGFPHAERRALHGNNDLGDITGCGPVVFEVKNHRELKLSEWLEELQIEIQNANADTGAVIAKRRGITNPAMWYAVMPAYIFVDLLVEAGYGVE